MEKWRKEWVRLSADFISSGRLNVVPQSVENIDREIDVDPPIMARHYVNGDDTSLYEMVVLTCGFGHDSLYPGDQALLPDRCIVHDLSYWDGSVPEYHPSKELESVFVAGSGDGAIIDGLEYVYGADYQQRLAASLFDASDPGLLVRMLSRRHNQDPMEQPEIFAAEFQEAIDAVLKPASPAPAVHFFAGDSWAGTASELNRQLLAHAVDRELATVSVGRFDFEKPQDHLKSPSAKKNSLLIWRVGPTRVQPIKIDGVTFAPRSDTREPEALRRFSELERFIVR